MNNSIGLALQRSSGAESDFASMETQGAGLSLLG